MMKSLIIYETLSGNTEEVGELIQQELNSYSVQSKLINIRNDVDLKEIKESDFIFLGSYTWGDGELPDRMRSFLRKVIKEEKLRLPPFSVFGTGDTDFHFYCRAVDEMVYHLGKVTTVYKILKNEQAPRSKYQKQRIENFVKETLEELINE
ncbi:flavodoxin domain-containing protein [Priestia megaterium]|uniref:flavodoxin domain-containing protein n=1 Tax=Priestia megaterium TaxID=1404 RepID=UPI003CC65983